MALNMFAPQQSQTNKPLVEFRAGKMTQNAQTKLVTADKRKGLVQLTQSPDSLIHFIWKDRTTGAVEDDLIIFPEEAVFKRAKDRAFLLEFKDSSRKLFFWMQEPKDDKDEEYLTKINQHINNPPALDAMDEMDETPSPNNEGINQSILNQMLQSASQQPQQQQSRPTTTTTAPTTTTTASTTASTTTPTPTPATNTSSSSTSANQVNINNLQNILGSMLQQAMPEQSPSYLLGIALPYIFQSDLLLPVLTLEMREKLVEDLPEGIKTPHEVTQTILSPQFQQAIQTFSYALQTGQLNYIIGQLGADQAELQKNLQSFAQYHASRQKQRKEKGDKMDL